jgi:glyoxylase-like metal-dependent hydrolase (beta-lactamase superfamily II)
MTVIKQDDKILIKRLETTPYGTNAYILVCQRTKESVIVDAPGDAPAIIDSLEGTSPRYILITHSHFDHTGALQELKQRLNVPVAAHETDANRIPLTPDLLLIDGDCLTLGDIELKVIHTPGHTPGSLCFLTGLDLLSGDTLFPGGPGKTGSPSDLEQIITSIKEKIFVLPDEVRVYPGHGEWTALKKEKEEFAVFSSREHSPNLCGDVLWLSS